MYVVSYNGVLNGLCEQASRMYWLSDQHVDIMTLWGSPQLLLTTREMTIQQLSMKETK